MAHWIWEDDREFALSLEDSSFVFHSILSTKSDKLCEKVSLHSSHRVSWQLHMKVYKLTKCKRIICKAVNRYYSFRSFFSPVHNENKESYLKRSSSIVQSLQGILNSWLALCCKTIVNITKRSSFISITIKLPQNANITFHVSIWTIMYCFVFSILWCFYLRRNKMATIAKNLGKL